MMQMLKNIAPGKILFIEFMKPLGMTVSELAGQTGLRAPDAERLLAGAHAIDKQIADSLGRLFNVEPEFWLNLQATYDRRRRTVIFLDFDGVLHSASGRDELWGRTKALACVMRDYPEVRIVISSSWRERRDINELRLLLGDELGAKVIDAIPVIRSANRQTEIEAWLADNPTERYVALDDMPELFEKYCPWLIRTDRGVGLDGRSIQLLREMLESFARI